GGRRQFLGFPEVKRFTERSRTGAKSPVLPPLYTTDKISGFLMYDDFYVIDRWTKKQLHCMYQAQIVAIATRHADAVDYKFLAGGRPVWMALPCAAWAEYKR